MHLQQIRNKLNLRLIKILLFFVAISNFNTLKATQIFDCFTFYNELELLKMRFEELYDAVDYFVLVESPISYTGKSKSLYYQENAHSFEKYQDKIIHIVIDQFPGLTGNAEADH